MTHEEDRAVQRVLDELRKEYSVPRLAAIVVSDSKVIGSGTVGERSSENDDDETWPLGRCTAVITATVAARLIEAGQLDWNWNVGKCLGAAVEYIDRSLREITFAQILQHKTGLMISSKILKYAYETNDAPRRARLRISRMLLNEPLKRNPTNKYSDANLILAGTIIETIAKKPFEEAVQLQLFRPLGMSHSKFTGLQLCGHVFNPDDDSIRALTSKDCTPLALLAPVAGALAPLREAAILAQLHLQGLRSWASHATGATVNENFLKAHTIRTMHSSEKKKQGCTKWGLSGFALHTRHKDEFGGHISYLEHGGEKEPFAARIILYPYLNRAIVAFANLGGGSVNGSRHALVSGDRALDKAPDLLMEEIEALVSHNKHHQSHLHFSIATSKS